MAKGSRMVLVGGLVSWLVMASSSCLDRPWITISSNTTQNGPTGQSNTSDDSVDSKTDTITFTGIHLLLFESQAACPRCSSFSSVSLPGFFASFGSVPDEASAACPRSGVPPVEILDSLAEVPPVH